MGKVILDTKKRSEEAEAFEDVLRSAIVGQDEAIRSVTDLYENFRSGLQEKGRTVGNFLFAGPTGCGKTRLVEVAAEILFGGPRKFIKVDCAEFQHSHEIAKLIGSPPGYLGHRETHPLITQESLAESYTDKLKLSFLLFDEIEKASDSLWNLLLGMLDRATLTLGDNRRVDLSQVVIFMTSNVGGSQITNLMTGGYGFIKAEDKAADGLDQKVEKTVMESARRKFAPEFVNRLDKVVVFRALDRPQLEKVLEIELRRVQSRVFGTAGGGFIFSVSAAARKFLLDEGTDLRYGARHLKRTIEKHVVRSVAKLIGTSQVHPGDVLAIDFSGGDDLQFSIDVPMPIVKVELPSQPVAALRRSAAAGSAGSYA